MAEYSANAVQTVNPGETIVFTDTPVPCPCGCVRHREGTGVFLLSGNTRRLNRRSVNYLVDFGANIAIPEGETVQPITVAITLDGNSIPATQMEVTPAAVDEYFNVSRAANVQIWCGCCENVSVRNTSPIPILVQNANVIVTPPKM